MQNNKPKNPERNSCMKFFKEKRCWKTPTICYQSLDESTSIIPVIDKEDISIDKTYFRDPVSTKDSFAICLR